MRAKMGALVIATANMICGRPRSSQATMPMASRIPGMLRRTSTKRIRTVSTLPPRPPARAPMPPPMNRPMITDATPATRLTRAP